MLNEWRERCHDQKTVWLVMRVEKCKIVWLTLAGEITTMSPTGACYWSRKQHGACCWTDREEAYQMARASGGLLYRYDRGE